MMYNLKDLTTFEEMLTADGSEIIDFKVYAKEDSIPNIFEDDAEDEQLYIVVAEIKFNGKMFGWKGSFTNDYCFYCDSSDEMHQLKPFMATLVHESVKYNAKQKVKSDEGFKQWLSEIGFI